MSECEKECVFNSNNECWLACKNKFYNQALEDFAEQFKAHCRKFTTKSISDADIDWIKNELTK